MRVIFVWERAKRGNQVFYERRYLLRRHAADNDVGRAGGQVFAVAHTADGRVVLRATVAACDDDGAAAAYLT